VTALITADSVGKVFYKVERSKRANLTRDLLSLLVGRKPAAAKYGDATFHALRDLNFTVERGEVLGIIGHNGAGKTTLLRILAGEIVPDEGQVTLSGSRGTLIDLTGGFSTSLSGRDNIYFRGAYLGFSREQIQRIEQDIIDFTEIGEFIDADVKTYSSGMMLRLGFAVSVFLKPDILLVDEIIAVGDFMFAAKCMRKMNEMKSNAAIVFVTHSMEIAVQFCDRLMLMDRGECLFLGAPEEAIRLYYQVETEKHQSGGSRLSRATARPAISLSDTDPGLAGGASQGPDGALVSLSLDALPLEAAEAGPVFEDMVVFEPPPLVRAAMSDFTPSDAALRDVSITWLNADGTRLHTVESGAPVTALIRFRSPSDIQRLVIGIPIWNDNSVLVSGFGSQNRITKTIIKSDDINEIRLSIKSFTLSSGNYYPVLAILDGAEYLYRRPHAPIRVRKNSQGLEWGIVHLDYSWKMASV